MDNKKEIVKLLVGISGQYSYHIVFQDWVETMALSIQNSCCIFHDKLWNDREDLYKNIMNKYTLDERKQFPEMFMMLVDEFENGTISDVLGEIYMSQNSGNKHLGQFFTPFHLSELSARLALENYTADWDGQKKLEINEPSTGGGGMMIAIIKRLKELGIDYQRKVHIVAQDLDWNGVFMTYVQLSLLGADATVVQGDTLCNPYVPGQTKASKIFRTPMRMGVLL